MAKYPVYSYRDKSVGFGAPVVESNEYCAKRGFAMRVTNDPGVMGYAPSDFDLYKIGEFDTKTGLLDPCTPQFVVNGATVVGDKDEVRG